MELDRQVQLEKEIDRHNQLYWEEHSPEIPDDAYDALVEELRAIDPENIRCSKVFTPTLSGKKKIRHQREMKSLGKCYTLEEFLKWAAGVVRDAYEAFSIEPKYDGWSAEYVPADGKRKDVLSTRGEDGVEGDDITDRIPLMTGVFASRQQKGGEPRYGEVVIMKSDFDKYRPQLKKPNGEPVKNTRSALSMLLGGESPPSFPNDITPVTFIEYGAHKIIATYADLKGMEWDEVMQLTQQADYPTDGLVIKLVDSEYAETLGSTEHHPRGAIAWKYRNPEAVTKLLNVVWQCGKGVISPVAMLAPVELSGVTISKATLHNLQDIQRKGICVGDEVVIARCGDVIPGVVRVHTEGKLRYEIHIDSCPACGAAVLTKPDSPYVFCSSGKSCVGSAAVLLKDALIRLGIDGVGPGIAAVLVAQGYTTVVDVFSRMGEEEWVTLPGFGARSGAKAFKAVQERINTPCEPWRVLACLNIPGIGETLSKRIMDSTGWDQLLNMTSQEISDIDGIGEVRGQLIASELQVQQATVAMLRATLTLKTPVKGTKTVCFTGANDRPRSWWIKEAGYFGYEYSKGVTKSLGILVCADVNSTSTKAQKARKYGITVMSYAEFSQNILGFTK